MEIVDGLVPGNVMESIKSGVVKKMYLKSLGLTIYFWSSMIIKSQLDSDVVHGARRWSWITIWKKKRFI